MLETRLREHRDDVWERLARRPREGKETRDACAIFSMCRIHFVVYMES